MWDNRDNESLLPFSPICLPLGPTQRFKPRLFKIVVPIVPTVPNPMISTVFSGQVVLFKLSRLVPAGWP
jgi:hypothetical protein